ncbi:hypothetical protein NliqN6_3633 [Naganishia liquefaciens]|uniref:Cyclin N-terminal domain-containing protein n=1 Tax=Naganishia liquefaciens TaxID=104408 RepID=A0A8H3TUL6_9TREE|nr:hypothetical protein NliqN6_3633 [Naganishia liquefaciens]
MSSALQPRRTRASTRLASQAPDENAIAGTSRVRTTKASTSSIPVPAKRVGLGKVKNEYSEETIKKVSSATTAVRARRAALGELQSNKENARSAGTDSKADVKKTVDAKASVASRPKPIQRRSTRQLQSLPADEPVEEKRPAVVRHGKSSAEERATVRPRVTRTTTTETLASTTNANIPRRVGLKRTHTATSTTEARIAKPAATSKLRVKHEADEHDGEPSSKRQRTTSPAQQEDTDVEGYVAPKKLFSKTVATTKEFDDAHDEEPMLSPASDVSETNGRDPRVVVDMDADDEDDPTMVLEYQEDIFEYMRDLEYKLMPNHRYMDDQPNLKWEMRGILTDWLIEVHNKFRLLPETLFLAINIADRFLSARVVSLSKLQLVGLTCLFIAAKYEEVICPSVSNFLYMADGGYTDEEIIAAEKYVLTTLNFDLSYPNPMHFLRRVSKAEGYDIQSRTVAKYLMEISLVDERFLSIEPSRLAASATWMARLVLGRDEWDATLTHYSGYEEQELLEPAQMYLDYILNQEYPQHEAFMKKYSARKYMKAAPYVRSWAEGEWPYAKEDGLEHDEIQTLVDQRGPLKMYRGLRK